MTPADSRAGARAGDLGSVEVLASAALQLGADQVPGWSAEERALALQVPRVPVGLSSLRERIRAGEDPLGSAFARLRSPDQRRLLGQTYTPEPIVASMVAWAADHGAPDRVIDPGTGSARFLLAAGRRFPRAQLVGVDVDPLACLMARGNVAAAGMAGRARVLLTDYRALPREPAAGRTLYLGNPPYVRHHQIDRAWKRWLVETAHGLGASQLAGLHVHFFLATCEHGWPGDYGAFITSAEWLDVNYGRLVRGLLLDGLGGTAVHVLEPVIAPFADAATTGAITCFELGTRPASLRMRRVQRVEDLGRLAGGRSLARATLAKASRWGPLGRAVPKLPDGWIELGELCRVHRGAATGANAVWVMPRHAAELPERFLFPSITRARELFDAGEALVDPTHLRLVADLPEDLDTLTTDERTGVDRFLREAKRAGAADGYIARHRKAWWSVGLRSPAPLLATYMARRSPAFVRNLAHARHINIAHGLYPREPLPDGVLDKVAHHLRTTVSLPQGRTYAGGLTKFEPKEMERLPIPAPELLLP